MRIPKMPEVFLASDSIVEGVNVVSFADGTQSDVSWGQDSNHGCDQSIYMGSRSNTPGAHWSEVRLNVVDD